MAVAGAPCWRHDRAAAAERGKRGRRKQLDHQHQAKAEVVADLAAAGLDTGEGIRAHLARALADVEQSDATPIARAGAVARLCGVAIKVVETVDLQQQVAELRALVERHLADHGDGRRRA